jgi:hypothetical protein
MVKIKFTDILSSVSVPGPLPCHYMQVAQIIFIVNLKLFYDSEGDRKASGI